MRKVFWENPYQQSLTTKVASVNGNKVLFDETIAYSFSGAQESDKAWVNGIPIIDSKMEDNFIYYTFQEGHGFSKGDVVEMVIDWPRRYRLMRLHFAAELILEIITKKFQLKKVGAHIAEHKARIDFEYDKNISELFENILEEYNKIIKADKPIMTGFANVEHQRRYWKIEGFAQVPCGGTHVKSTSEVGFVTLKRDKPGKGIERVVIKLVEDFIP